MITWDQQLSIHISSSIQSSISKITKVQIVSNSNSTGSLIQRKTTINYNNLKQTNYMKN